MSAGYNYSLLISKQFTENHTMLTVITLARVIQPKFFVTSYNTQALFTITQSVMYRTNFTESITKIRLRRNKTERPVNQTVTSQSNCPSFWSRGIVIARSRSLMIRLGRHAECFAKSVQKDDCLGALCFGEFEVAPPK